MKTSRAYEGFRAAIDAPEHHFRYYDVAVITFVVILLISNLVGQKICAFGPFRIAGAQLLFPITYIFGDIFTEVYGYAGSRRAIWLGFVVMTIAFWGTISLGLIETLIVSGCLAKVLYEAAATPFTYMVVNFLKRREGVDVYDDDTDFSPFGRGSAGERFEELSAK